MREIIEGLRTEAVRSYLPGIFFLRLRLDDLSIQLHSLPAYEPLYRISAAISKRRCRAVSYLLFLQRIAVLADPEKKSVEIDDDG